MEPKKIYTRVFSTTSPRRLVSGQAEDSHSSQAPHESPPLHPYRLKYEFINHSRREATIPTALVSVSSRLIDTVTRAYKLREEGEDPENILIVFVKTPDDMTARSTPRIHYGEKLAAQFGLPKPEVFRYECVVEWAIPSHWIKHTVSLQTLVDRGLGWERHFGSIYASNELLEQVGWRGLTQTIRLLESQRYQDCSPWEIGINIGCLTKCLGADAPLSWVQKQLFQDLFVPWINKDYQFNLHIGDVVYQYEIKSTKADINEGIDSVVIDGWLTSDGFVAEYAAYGLEE